MSESRSEEAVNRMAGGLLCSQSILLTYGPQFGIDEGVALRAARPFGSGVARMCETCGAVSGAYMVLGLRHTEADEKEAKEATYVDVREFTRRFKQRNGSINCQTLLGCDLGTPEGQQFFRDQGKVSLCHAYVRDAALILEEMFERK